MNIIKLTLILLFASVTAASATTILTCTNKYDNKSKFNLVFQGNAVEVSNVNQPDVVAKAIRTNYVEKHLLYTGEVSLVYHIGTLSGYILNTGTPFQCR